MKKLWAMLPLAIFLIFSAFFWRGLRLNPHDLPSAQIGRKLPDFIVQSLANNAEFSASQLRGKISLLNVWASWCSSCIEEQVFLLKLSHQGMPIYGLNYKDNPQRALQWLHEWGNPYQDIGQDLDGKLAIDLGVYGAPETFLIDTHGKIQFRHVGPLNEVVWEQEFIPRIKHLRETIA
jgi:cytochrome c biogenesis protein CcmG/thiol:disulfide interchange protein DsbE